MQVKGTLNISVESQEELTAVTAFLQSRKKVAPEASIQSAGFGQSNDNLLDLVTENHQELIEWLRIVKVLSQELPVRIDQTGLHCRLSDGPGRQVVFDSQIGKPLFSTYHLKVPAIDITIQDVGVLLQAIERIRLKGQPVHLWIERSDQGVLRVGEDYSVKLGRCVILKERVEPSKADVGASLSMNASSSFWLTRKALIALMMDNKANASYVDFAAGSSELVLESHTETGDFSKKITEHYRCTKPSRSRLNYVDLLLRCLKASRCEKITIDNLGTFLQIWFSGSVHARRILILACKRIAEKSESISQES